MKCTTWLITLFISIVLCVAACSRNQPATSDSAVASFTYARAYHDGDVFEYELKAVSTANGKSSEEIGHSRHTVSTTGGAHEVIRWIELKRTDAAGHSVTDSTAVADMSAYAVSLATDGGVRLPPLTVPAMTGMVTDLNTFYVAISPALGIGRLHKLGDVVVCSTRTPGDWSDGKVFILGQDYTSPTLTITAMDAETVSIRTVFAAPEQAAINMHTEWMRPPVVAGIPNNFQMIKREAAGTLMVMWGHEEFTTNVVVRRSDGIILRAHMDNLLTMKLRIGCNEEMTSYQAEIPLEKHRSLDLTLH